MLSAEEFLTALERLHLLSAAQQDEARALRAARPDARSLAGELLRRDWLTPYQVNQLLQGRGPDLVLGSYVLLQRLGEGGMGQVFKARHQGLGRIVALKLVRKDRVNHPDAVRRFHQEIRAAAQLSHPNIVHVFDADQVGSTHFFTMEYVEGIDLSRHVKEHGPLPWPEAFLYLRQAALALQHCMERGLVHRDVKPANLLVTGTPQTPPEERALKVLDMGLARLRVGDGEGVSMVTAEGAIMGTPDYMAPEQASSSHAVDIRADLYSLGCTAYYLLTGAVPFPGGTVFEKIDRHRQAEPLPLEQCCPGLPAGLADAVRRLMAKDPAQRFQTPAALTAALARGLSPDATVPGPTALLAPDAAPALLAGGAVQAAPVRTVVPAPATEATFAFAQEDTATDQGRAPGRSAQQRRGPWLVAASSLVLLGIAGFVVWLLRPPPPPPPAPPPPTRAEQAEAEWKRLLGQSGDSASSRADLARGLRTLRMRYPETAAALDAARRLRHLPSPLDALRREDIPATDRPAWLPPEVVAVFGEQHGRLWGDVAAVAFRADGSLLASVGAERQIHVWDVAGEKERAVFAVQAPATGVVALSPDGGTVAAAVPGKLGNVVLYDVNTGEARPPLPGLRGLIRCLAFAADGRTLAAGYQNGAVLRWDVATGKRKGGRRVHAAPVLALAFDASGTLLSADRAGVVTCWQAGGPKQIFAPSAPPTRPALPALAPGGKFLALGADRVAVIDLATGKVLARSEEMPRAVHSLAISPDGSAVVWSMLPYRLTRWEWQAGEPKRIPHKAAQAGRAAAFAPDGKTFAVAYSNGPVVLYDTATLQKQASFGRESGELVAVAVHPDGKTLLWGTNDGVITFHDVEKGKEVRTLTPRLGIVSLAVSPNGGWLASTGVGGVRAWDLKESDDSPAFSRPSGHASAFAPDGRRLAIAAAEGVELWDLGQHPAVSLRSLPAFAPTVAVAYARDGKALAAGGNQPGELRLWLGEGAERSIDLPGEAVALTALAFDPDGKTLAALAPGRPLLLFDVATRKTRPPPANLLAGRRGLACSPDGRTLAWATTGAWSITVWESASGQQRTLSMPGPVRSLAFAPDSRHLLTANGNGSAYVLRLEGP